jgi:hypothetical protein
MKTASRLHISISPSIPSIQAKGIGNSESIVTDHKKCSFCKIIPVLILILGGCLTSQICFGKVVGQTAFGISSRTVL